jgi:hypothetical protein
VQDAGQVALALVLEHCLQEGFHQGMRGIAKSGGQDCQLGGGASQGIRQKRGHALSSGHGIGQSLGLGAYRLQRLFVLGGCQQGLGITFGDETR